MYYAHPLSLKEQREVGICRSARLSQFLTKLSNISRDTKQISKSQIIPLYIGKVFKIS